MVSWHRVQPPIVGEVARRLLRWKQKRARLTPACTVKLGSFGNAGFPKLTSSPGRPLTLGALPLDALGGQTWLRNLPD